MGCAYVIESCFFFNTTTTTTTIKHMRGVFIAHGNKLPERRVEIIG